MGPCRHCQVESTPQWRPGPDGEKTLCNACGLRWRSHGDLKYYTPRHALTQRNEMNRNHLEIEEHTDNSSSKVTSADKRIKCERKTSEEESSGNLVLSQPSFGLSRNPKRKWSLHDQDALTTVESLHKKLKRFLHQPDFRYLLEEEEEVLINTVSSQMSSGETGIGCVLLESPGSD